MRSKFWSLLLVVGVAAGCGAVVALTARDATSPTYVVAQSPVSVWGRRSQPTFTISIDGMPTPYFLGVESISAAIEVVDKAAADARVSDPNPGRTLPLRLVMIKDLGDKAPQLYQWWHANRRGQVQHKAITITAGEGGRALRSWRYIDCWPAEWKVATEPDGTVVERVTFICEDLTIDQ